MCREARIKVLKFFRYRTGMIQGNSIIEFPRETQREFEKRLACIAGVNADNHTCYVVEMDDIRNDKKVVAFMFSDLIMSMGDQVVERRS